MIGSITPSSTSACALKPVSGVSPNAKKAPTAELAPTTRRQPRTLALRVRCGIAIRFSVFTVPASQHRDLGLSAGRKPGAKVQLPPTSYVNFNFKSQIIFIKILEESP